uniref:Fibroblast growth factor n=1 Tax=Lygus hesperus TaxID=30085 RepID=A0A0A9WU13_LYGHE
MTRHLPCFVAAVLQRSSVSLGQVKIQGVATCMFLCMDMCGIPYSSREFTDECVFNEKIEQHSYNTYSSTKYSNAKRTLYLGMTRKGEARRVQVRTGTVLGRLSTFTRVLTQSVGAEEASTHGRTVCLHLPPPRHPRPPRCRLRARGRPRRRKKKPDEAAEDPPPPRRPLRRKCEPGKDCQRRLHIGRKRKSRLEGTGGPRRLRHRKHRTAVRLKEEEEEEAEEEAEEKVEEEGEDEDVTMTTEDELLSDDHTDLFQDNNDND